MTAEAGVGKENYNWTKELATVKKNKFNIGEKS